MPGRVSSRVLRHERVGRVRLTPWGGLVMGGAEEPRDASAGRCQAVALPPSAALGGLRAGCGRTGAVGVPSRVAPRASGQRAAAPRVSTQALGEVQSRMTTRMDGPQVGQRTTSGCGGVRGVGCSSLGGPCPIRRRMVAGGRAQRAWSTPQGRTCPPPSGTTCGRTLRSNARTSRWAVRGRARPPVREVQGTGRSCRPTRRLWEMATVQTDGAREGKAEWPWCWA